MLNEATPAPAGQPPPAAELTPADETLIDIVRHLRWTPKDARDRTLKYLSENALGYEGSERYKVLLNIQAFTRNAATLPRPDEDWSLNTQLRALAPRFGVHPALLISAAQRGHKATPLN